MIIFLMLGIILTSIGLMFIFLYTNLLTMGYSFLEFVNFISRQIECWSFVVGILLIIYTYERWLKKCFITTTHY